MSNSARGGSKFLLAGLLVIAAGGGYLAYRAARGTSGAYTYQPTTRPALPPGAASTQTGRTTEPSRPADKGPTTTFIDVVRAVYPKYLTTRPLELPVRDLAEAGRILLTDPVYVGRPSREDLWITRPDGLPTQDALRRAMDTKLYPQVHVLPERVRFVHWSPGPKGWTPFAVVDRPGGAGLDVVSPARREPITADRSYHWSRAINWNDAMVVPSDAGMSVFRFEPSLTEQYYELLPPTTTAPAATAPAPDAQAAAAKTPRPEPLALLDVQGLLAWVPPEDGRPGSVGAARYVDGQWVPLGPAQGWPEQILQLVPLLDGSVLQIAVNPDGTVRLTLASLYAANIDEAALTRLVEQMSDPDDEKREAAFKELSLYGPGAYSLLEKLAAEQPPEARARLRSLMRTQVQPTLGGMTLLGNRLETVTRHVDGGAVFFAADGVSIPRGDGPPTRRVPAWLSLRPGRAAEVLDGSLVGELDPKQSEVIVARQEWIVAGDAPGPRRWVGNGLVPMLKKSELAFSELLGADRRGRWLFRKPGDDRETLILDPSLPDPTPKLPFWEYTTARAFGWDARDYPTVRREGGDWSIREKGWELLDEKEGERLLTELPAPGTLPTAGGATQPSTSASSQPADGGPPALLVAADGTRYYDGLTSLRVVTKDGAETTWPLPPEAHGTGTPTLIRTAEGLLFLFNQPGRVLRIRPSPGEAEPFTVEATFTRNIPSFDKPRRIWLDPAGRIVISDVRRLILFFPQGFIPPQIRDLMPVEDPDEEVQEVPEAPQVQ